MHADRLKTPEEALDENVTVPVGVIGAPALVSVTVTVHVVEEPCATGLGAQTTLVEVARAFTVRLKAAVPEAWKPSPG